MILTWFCGECGTEFSYDALAEEAPCPACGRILTNDVELTRCILEDVGLVVE
jgi:DNA-directed RNA polymerase subunit RPC12/RpoP